MSAVGGQADVLPGATMPPDEEYGPVPDARLTLGWKDQKRTPAMTDARNPAPGSDSGHLPQTVTGSGPDWLPGVPLGRADVEDESDPVRGFSMMRLLTETDDSFLEAAPGRWYVVKAEGDRGMWI